MLIPVLAVQAFGKPAFQTLFNPNKTVVKMFVVVYDLSDMPPNSQTFLRQRTLYMPVKGSPSDTPNFMVYLRYLIHLRLVFFSVFIILQEVILSRHRFFVTYLL